MSETSGLFEQKQRRTVLKLSLNSSFISAAFKIRAPVTKTFIHSYIGLSWRPYVGRMRSFVTHSCPFIPSSPAPVFVRRWSLAECHINASRGATGMGAFSVHSAGVIGSFGGVIRVSVSSVLCLQQLQKQPDAGTHWKICPNLYLN